MTAREPRIDIIRGCSILFILINHLTQVAEFGGLKGWMIPTPTRYGYSTAAESFVIMSGYMVGLVYMARARPMQAIWRRAARLWAYNVALLVIVLALVAFMPADEMGFWRLDGFVSAPVAATLHFLTLQDAPRLLDILQLYIKLMLVSPIAIWIHRRSPAALISISVGLYLVAQVLTVLHLSASPDATTDGALDLLSWQMLFFVPMALGAMRAHVRLFRWLDRNWAMLVLLLALFVIGAATRQLQMEEILAEPEWLTGRYGLNPLRLAHAIMMLMLYASALTLAGGFLQHWSFRAIGGIGLHSLDCFVAGVVATYGLVILWKRTGGGYPEYYLFAAASVGLTIVIANSLEARRKQRTRNDGTARRGSRDRRSAQEPCGAG